MGNESVCAERDVEGKSVGGTNAVVYRWFGIDAQREGRQEMWSGT